MARLPEIQPRGSVIQGPRSSVSASEIASPYQQIAAGFDAWGETLQAAANEDATTAGQNAVSRDADGNLKVDLRDNVSQMNRNYNRAATMTFAARREIDAKSALAQQQIDANGNPDAFRASSKAYRDQTLINTPKQLRGPIGTMLDEHIEQNYNGLVRQKYSADMNMSKSTYLEALAMKDNDRATLARQGGIETPAYKKAYAETQALLKELSGNPAFQFSANEAEMRLKQAMDRDKTEAWAGEADRLIESGGSAEALKVADRLLTDQSINMPMSERRQRAGQINESVRSYRAEQKAAIEPFKDRAKDKVKLWDAGTNLDDADNEELIATIRQGDPSYASYLSRVLTTRRQVRTMRSLNDREQVDMLEQSRRGSGNVVDKIIGVESSGNPNAQPRDASGKLLSSAGGLGQFIDSTWLSMMGKYRPDITAGKTAQQVLALKTDPALSREMTARYTQENTQFLQNQGIPTTDANVYLAHFLGPRGAAQVLKADPSTPLSSILGQDAMNANSFLQGKTVADLRAWSGKKMGEGTSPLTGEAAQALQTEVTSDLRRDLGDYKTQLMRGNIPDQDSLNLLSRQLSLVDDQDLRSEYATVFRQSEAFQQAYQTNPAAAESFLSSLDARAAGQGATIAEMQITDAYRSGATAAAAAKKSDPLGYAMKAYTGFPDLPMLDVNNPASYGATLQAYQQGVNIAQAHGEMAGIPAFRPAQADAIARMWQAGNPDQLNALTSAMASSLTPETLKATLSSGPIKEALSGAILSSDPIKHSTAMQQLDLLSERVSMPELESTFGPDAVDRLQDWQAKVRYFTPDETADWLKQRNDPRWQERVKPLVDKGKTEARKVSAATVIDKLDTNRIFDASGPIDAETQRMMMNDYVSLVGERNGSLDNIETAKTQAIARMQKIWGVTGVYGDRGGRVMPYPPEAFYPEVNGSKDWINRELQSFATDRKVELGNVSLIADQKTEAAAQHGELPGYLISVIDPKTGLSEIVSDDQGRPLRHFFDPQAMQQGALSAAQAARQRLGPAAVQERVRQTLATDPVPAGSFLGAQGDE